MYLPLVTVTGVHLRDVRERLPACCTLDRVSHFLVKIFFVLLDFGCPNVQPNVRSDTRSQGVKSGIGRLERMTRGKGIQDRDDR
jgi:hypothetical protein